jgi:hypothetical protein
MRNKNSQTQLLALYLLEACLKNCGMNFHFQVSAKSFVKTMSELGTSKKSTPAVRDKALDLLRQLSEAWRSRPQFVIFQDTVMSLTRQGVIFPLPDSTASPIFAPNTRSNTVYGAQHSLPEMQMANARTYAQPQSQAQHVQPPMHAAPAPQPASYGPVELEIIEGNCQLLGEMLTALSSPTEINGNELIDDFVETLERSQPIIQQMIINAALPEDKLAHCLSLNDAISQVLERASALKARASISAAAASTGLQNPVHPPPPVSPMATERLPDHEINLGADDVDVNEGGHPYQEEEADPFAEIAAASSSRGQDPYQLNGAASDVADDPFAELARREGLPADVATPINVNPSPPFVSTVPAPSAPPPLGVQISSAPLQPISIAPANSSSPDAQRLASGPAAPVQAKKQASIEQRYDDLFDL